ncbi:hypothetical protein [Paraferrimonas sp. SM1919]|uniref:hypothetical protein n=1 Tax=Paraferrimonas sp. SM1919 TaxID=2662263 RepID=UPI0013D2A184|nr:hypothetical protein [Paraferrimonas sp. SM1919]
MLRTTFLTIGLLMTSSGFASGTRSLDLFETAIEAFYQAQPRHLKTDSRYLGTTDKWHLFGLTQTDITAGMPWSHTYGIKIAIAELVIINGWQLDLTDPKHIPYIADCPRIKKLPKRENIAHYRVLKEERHNQCIEYLQGNNHE